MEGEKSILPIKESDQVRCDVYLSRLRSPLLSGAVLPDPDLELAEAEVEERSIRKGLEEKLRQEHVDGKEDDQHKQNW